jgi:hypothetical protein
MFVCRMARIRQAARKSMNPYVWRPLPHEVPKIIEVFSDSEVEKFVEFKPVMEVEPLLDFVGPGEVDFEDLEAEKPKKKQMIEDYNSDTSDASGDFEIVDLIGESEYDEEDFYDGEDPYLFIRDSKIDCYSD